MIDEFWAFARARQQLMVTGETKNEILKEYRFTNCYRVCDRVSQYLVREIINKDYENNRELLFHILLFKTFNKIHTWEWIQHVLRRKPRWSKDWIGQVEYVLRLHENGRHLYAAAFRQPHGKTSFGCKEKYQNHLHMIEYVLTGQHALWNCQSLEQLWRTLLGVPMMGPFLAMQFATDLNYSRLFDFDANDFIHPGPGALRGAAKVQGRLDWKNVDAARSLIGELAADQDRAGFPCIRTDRGTLPLSAMDVQNLLCEFDKYCRVARPELNAIGRWRKGEARRPKQRYVPHPCRMRWPEDYVFPVKWGI